MAEIRESLSVDTSQLARQIYEVDVRARVAEERTASVARRMQRQQGELVNLERASDRVSAKLNKFGLKTAIGFAAHELAEEAGIPDVLAARLTKAAVSGAFFAGFPGAIAGIGLTGVAEIIRKFKERDEEAKRLSERMKAFEDRLKDMRLNDEAEKNRKERQLRADLENIRIEAETKARAVFYEAWVASGRIEN